MNSESKPCFSADVTSSRKKSRRRNRRNKYKNYINKKNYYKKLKSNFTDHSKKSKQFNSSGNSSWKIMSNWYWSNYKKAFEWQDRHKIAHWKSCALALQEENRCLMQLINSMQGSCPKLPVTMQDLNKHNYSYRSDEGRANKNFKHRNQNINRNLEVVNHTSENLENMEEDCEEEYEFEMSEEMMKFFETSFKHKMDLQKLKEEKAAKEEEKKIEKIQTNRLKRSEEMQLLYGDSASMIIGMETAVQLSFDRFCDTKSPKFWPNIPLRL